MRSCPKCRAENEDDSNFCDQCSAPLAEKAPGDGCCPECGGEVEEAAGGKGVCKECGAELLERNEDAPESQAPEPAVQLASYIKESLASGLPLDAAVEAACRRFFLRPEAEDKREGSVPCPVCGEGNPAGAVQCGGCAILFEAPALPVQCPVCAEKSSGDECSCGATLTLPKLVEFLDDSVQFLCPHCKALFNGPRTECSDCGNSPLVSADRLKEFARRKS